MPRTLCLVRILTTAGSLALSAGCWDGKPPVSASMTEATVRGKVLLDGKPVTQGSVLFDAGNYRRKISAREAQIGKNGTYIVKTLIGDNTITVRGPEIDRDRDLAYQQFLLGVGEGENAFDINLKRHQRPSR
jgi:hypothetical protein